MRIELARHPAIWIVWIGLLGLLGPIAAPEPGWTAGLEIVAKDGQVGSVKYPEDPADASHVYLDCCGQIWPGIHFETPSNEGALYASWIFFEAPAKFTLGADVEVNGKLINDLSAFEIWAEGNQQRYLVDSDDDSTGTPLFIWYQDSTANEKRQMQLSNGNLMISGGLTENQGFDLAESFLAAGPIEPGELVAVAPGRPRSVQRAAGSSGRRLLGVASTRPGIVLGGGAFSVEALERTWGAEVAGELRRSRAALEAQILAENETLRRERERVSSWSTFERAARAERAAPEEGSGEASAPRRPLHRRDFEEAKARIEERLEDLVIQRFFRERFVSVALAGRVEVLADASAGPIRQGDPLTAGPVPGVAVKATEPGTVVGIALEDLPSGQAKVLTLVDRSWYPGPRRHLATAPEDDEVDALRRRVAELESLIRSLDRAAVARPAERPAR